MRRRDQGQMNSNTLLHEAARLISAATNVYAFTGAGVSVESGIPDFRSASGLWSRFDPVEYGTLGAFRKHPEKVWKMLGELAEIADAKPNPGHVAMARMEERGWLKGIITQNIDGLHQKAGSCNVVEFHGTIFRLVCLSCGMRFPLEEFRHDLPPVCPSCMEIMKPDVVFFDESIPEEAFQAAREIVTSADLMIVAGTSCNVMPAAMIPLEVMQRGGKIIEINPEPALSEAAAVAIRAPFSLSMQGIFQALEAEC